MSDPSQQPPADPYRPQAPYQPQPPYGQQPGPVGPPPNMPPGYPPAGGWPTYVVPPQPPAHPQATTSMVLGIIGLGSVVLLCGVLLFLSPFAWVMGRKALTEIDASGGRIGGRSEANTGYITGIVGTVLLVLAIASIIAFIVIGISYDWWDDSDSGHYEYGESISLMLPR